MVRKVIPLEELRDWVNYCDKRARKLFRYVPEPEGRDEWFSHHTAVHLGERFTGDCDDLAATVIQLVCQDARVDRRKLFRLCVATPQTPDDLPFDHMVAAVDLGGRLYCIGDTNGGPERPARRGYRIDRYARVSEGLLWRRGAPFKDLSQ